MTLPEPDATQHHTRIVNALVVELEHYGVQALAGMIATILDDDQSPDVRVWAAKFRAMEAAPGATVLLADTRAPQDVAVTTEEPLVTPDDTEALLDAMRRTLWPLFTSVDTELLKWLVKDGQTGWFVLELAAQALDAKGLRCGHRMSRMRCQLHVGHGPHHKHNAAGW